MTTDNAEATGLALGSDESQLQASIERFIANEYTFDHYRETARQGGFNKAFWKQVADLGLIAACFPEQWGGYAQSGTEPFLVLEQFGRGLVMEPLVSAVLAPAAVLAASGERERFGALFNGLMTGDRLLALAWAEPNRRYDLVPEAVNATRTAQGWQLDGVKSTVLAAPHADSLLVSAATADGPAMFLVPKEASGIELVSHRNIDGQGAADVHFRQLTVDSDALVGEPGQGEALMRAGMNLGAAMSCAEAVGAMEAALALTVDYTQTRKQFGQAIASFQAIQHRLANMAIEMEYARATLQLLASGLFRGSDSERSAFVSGTRAKIMGCARLVVSEAVQLHGGIGVTDEASISHYFRKVVALDLAWGDSRYHLERYRTERKGDGTDLVGVLY